VCGWGRKVREATDCVEDYLYDHVYLFRAAAAGGAEGGRHHRELFGCTWSRMRHCTRLRGLCRTDAQARARLVCDYIAGMTDRFVRREYLRHSLPSGYPSFEER